MHRRDLLRGLVALTGTTAAWSVALPRLLGPAPEHLHDGPLPASTAGLVARAHRVWGSAGRSERDALLTPLRASNPEWDLLARMHTAMALANVALRDPSHRLRCMATLDHLATDTLQAHNAHGMHHWLLGYGRAGRFRVDPQASLFVDGELAIVLGSRLLLGPAPELREPFAGHIEAIQAQLGAGPLGLAESYPDECWSFCNALAAVALRMADALDGGDRPEAASVAAQLRARLVDPNTGLLISSFTHAGVPRDGPEGSSIWFVARCLQVVAPDFADTQYTLARQALGRTLSGFGWSVEWPSTWRGPLDIDSGVVIPGLDASPGASGHAVGAARAFGDGDFFAALYASLELGAGPMERSGERWYGASNLVGDAVLLEGLVCGPLWDEIARRRRSA